MDSSDEPEANSHTLRDLLADLNVDGGASSSSSNVRLPNPHSAAWFTSGSARSSPSHLVRPSVLLSRRASSRDNQSSDVDAAAATTAAPPSTTSNLFNNPNRSIFASGPPTSSISINTAQASMSAPLPSNSARPLAALTAPGVASGSGGSSSRRTPNPVPEEPSIVRRARFSGAEKDADDPSGAVEDSFATRGDSNTPTALSSLFTAPESGTPVASRTSSYIRTAGSNFYSRVSPETAPLPNHLYNKGLLSGRHSDITVHAFGTKYALHRLLLDRAPFFCTALSEPWIESSAKEITLHPEDVDSNITQAAFELALKRIYGCFKPEEEEKEAIGLFATGCWLDMADLIEASLNYLLCQMSPANLSTCIKFVTSSYYGKHGDRILAAAKAMLCRDGYEMLLGYWDGISGDIVREIIGSDGFYIPGEWERFILAKKILNRRLRAKAIELELLTPNGEVLVPCPASMSLMAIRFDTVYRNTSTYISKDATEEGDRWLGVYTSADVAPLLVLLDEGIHYIHLSFEQLQIVRDQKDILGMALLPEKVVSNALWMSMELRQRIANAKELDLDLGLSQYVEQTEDPAAAADAHDEDGPQAESSVGLSERAASKQRAVDHKDLEDREMVSGSWDQNGKPRKFWIPQADATYPMGGALEPSAAATTAAHISRRRRSSRLASAIDPQDVQWATDFATGPHDQSCLQSIPAVGNAPSPQVAYTHYPPFRFAVELPPARSLKENKRVYSNTVWYCGSLWNVYVQKKETPKHAQLGIYLHRERHVEGTEDLIASFMQSSVDERIGHLERELLIRRNGNNRRNAYEPRTFTAEELRNLSNDSTLIPGRAQDLDTLSGTLQHGPSSSLTTKASEASLPAGGGAGPAAHLKYSTGLFSGTDDNNNEGGAGAAGDSSMGTPSSRRIMVPALPPYVDARPTIKTYFKIYTPSKGGRVLSVYESAPDRFNFSQSWGWKSSNLIVDDGIGIGIGNGIGSGSSGGGSGGGEEKIKGKDPRLRFMVVIGNV